MGPKTETRLLAECPSCLQNGRPSRKDSDMTNEQVVADRAGKHTVAQLTTMVQEAAGALKVHQQDRENAENELTRRKSAEAQARVDLNIAKAALLKKLEML